jgi:transketolase
VIAQAMETARANPKIPVAIHAKTIKGIGTKKTMESASGGHGFPLKSPSELPAFLNEIYNNEPQPALYGQWIAELVKWEAEIKAKAEKDTGEKIQVGVSAAMIRARKEGLPVVSVTSDLPGSTGVAGFRKEFPKDSFDVGIAESNMVSAAAGFSKAGFIPVVDTFAQFGVTKGALPFIMSSLSEAPVIAIFSHTGFQDAADGASHQALSYLAMTSSIPHVDVVCLSCSEEADALVYQAIQDFAKARMAGRVPNSVIFFLGRENFPKNYGVSQFQIGQAQILANTVEGANKSVAIVTNGSLIPQALKAVSALRTKNIGAVLVNLATVNKMDMQTLSHAVALAHGNVLTVEDHQLIGGLGQMVAHALAEAKTSFRMKSLGVRGEFGQSAYTALDLYKKHGLDADSIVHQAQELVK